MNFSWTSEQLEFKDKIIEFAKAHLNDNLIDRDQHLNFSRSLWKKCADFGIQGLSVPKKYGGKFNDVDLLTATLAMEGLGYGSKDNGLPFALNAQMWTVQLPLYEFGTEEQREKFVRPMVTGDKIGAHGLTEPEAGSDVFNMQTHAKKVEGGYILNGQKRLITFGPEADIALIFANVNPKIGKWGVTGFIVERGTKGFIQGPNKSKMGLRTVPIGDLFFEDCFVPEENRLGKEGAGWAITSYSLEYDRCSILASQLGAMERQLETSIDFVKERQQFGKPISTFQSVSNRIADMKLRLETSRLLLYKVAWLKNQGDSAMLDAALLKLQLSESFITSSIDTIRNHGGSGYLTVQGVERDLRDAIGGVLYAGTSDIQRNIISQLLFSK
ncbi:acyl-CoA dehydrogenase family protein [Winogradskyella sp. PG-2]|uniref:acyl-CoA dehydrogenase family protein n=1 Tax=Winogradskyella sp. PG-2 TaxID=754409 RepID=UPI0004587240|nr:acyl-CoA dehydrogenase family protein [Winogradskyella sp. PG-2]BAO74616.1 butyryl-CoA dehydrogenase [Winogradskyella sp. PG-2]